MQEIPVGAPLVFPPRARVVVSKPVDHSVPKWGERSNQKSFTQWYPNVLHHKIPTEEVSEIQISSLSYRIRMLSQPVVENISRALSKFSSSLPGAFGYSSSYVDWRTKFLTPIQCCYFFVSRECPYVVDRVDAGPCKWIRGGKPMQGLSSIALATARANACLSRGLKGIVDIPNGSFSQKSGCRCVF